MSIIETDPPGDLVRLIQIARAQKRRLLSEPEAKAFLAAQGIPIPEGRFIRAPQEAGAALTAIGAPVVVKAVAPHLTHKGQAGGVIFPVSTPTVAEQACRTIAQRIKIRHPEITLDGFLIEAFRPAQPEWIMALRNDPQFGPVIMFGLGGALVESLRQVAFRLAPLTENEIKALLNEMPVAQLAKVAPGQAAASGLELSDVLQRLSDLAKLPEVHDIAEIEINPIVISEQGAVALDALIVLRA